MDEHCSPHGVRTNIPGSEQRAIVEFRKSPSHTKRLAIAGGNMTEDAADISGIATFAFGCV